MKIALTLKGLLAEKDINVSQLSRATKVARQTIDNWLSGQEPRSIKQVKMVADYFDVTVDELCFGKHEKKNVLESFEDEINAGIFEVILRKVSK